ncbi:DUF86 domain-containing protein [bacterium]|nr:DUF86 domain-containing protein [bacterium]MBU1881044.1 DUF86 domain-containing protein [bacterium]
MLDASLEIRKFCARKSRRSLNSDRKLTLALIKSIEIIGEAASKVSDEFQSSHPEIPWKSIIGMRNRLIHVYFDVNLDVLWNTVVEDIPPLLETLESTVQREL